MQGVLPGGARLADYLSVGVIAKVFRLGTVRAAPRELPAEAMV